MIQGPGLRPEVRNQISVQRLGRIQHGLVETRVCVCLTPGLTDRLPIMEVCTDLAIRYLIIDTTGVFDTP